MQTAQIRAAFLAFFQNHGHQIVPSSPLVPANDPSLLFTNAGMVQFKDVFLGAEHRPYRRAASAQRCVRAGGKHNDLENVGSTARHHTFFEMLGNFSFGDYFKREAIAYAWEFLTAKHGLALPPDRLLVTVYAADDEAHDIWAKQIGLPPDRLIRIGDRGGKHQSDNFWAMGESGPCGPCTEIFYDHGPQFPGGPPGSPDQDGDRFIEIWNLVFMQFDRTAAGLTPLPHPAVDTGMGLERIAAVLQGVHSNYETDLFTALLNAAAAHTNTDRQAPQTKQAKQAEKSLRVIADHIRSAAALVADGVLPSNEGRGYVLRRIIRRALRHGHKLGCTDPFFAALTPALVAQMGDAFPELAAQAPQIERTLLAEEQQFARTLDSGLGALETAIAKLDGTQLPGDLIFRLHDTYGFPPDLTADIARERGVTLDMPGFAKCLDRQRRASRGASKFTAQNSLRIDNASATEFVGHRTTRTTGRILALLQNGAEVPELTAGQTGTAVLERTAFYAESGGQVGDRGTLTARTARFEVADCQPHGSHHLHHGQLVRGTLRIGDTLKTQVDPNRRRNTARNHSATHLLHAALRQVLGDQATQQGSQVTADRLRFDFAHPRPVTPEEQQQIERLVNAEIRRNTPVKTELLPLNTAKQRGAMALFSEKYSDPVRVLTMGGGFSVELCGGTHVKRTGDIGILKIVAESAVAAGVRRIEALTAEAAEQHLLDLQTRLTQAAAALKTAPQTLVQKATQLATTCRDQQREIDQLKVKLANNSGPDLAAQAIKINGIPLLATRVDNLDPKSLRAMVDRLKNKLGSGVVVLGTATKTKATLICGVTPDLTQRIPANQLLAHLAPQIGGKSGGRPDLAQGGGPHPENLTQALKSAKTWLEKNV